MDQLVMPFTVDGAALVGSLVRHIEANLAAAEETAQRRRKQTAQKIVRLTRGER